MNLQPVYVTSPSTIYFSVLQSCSIAVNAFQIAEIIVAQITTGVKVFTAIIWPPVTTRQSSMRLLSGTVRVTSIIIVARMSSLTRYLRAVVSIQCYVFAQLPSWRQRLSLLCAMNLMATHPRRKDHVIAVFQGAVDGSKTTWTAFFDFCYYSRLH